MTGGHKQVIYFAQVADDEDYEVNLRVKIGLTTNPEQREVSHNKVSETGGRVYLKSVARVRGHRNDETTLKNAFSVHRYHGLAECFNPVPEITSYLRWLRDQHYVWVPDDPMCDPVCDMNFVDSSLWLPKSGRTKDGPYILPGLALHGPLNLPPRCTTADDYYTNKVIVDAARRVMGAVDLDPASHPVANRIVQAERIYARQDDGLTKPWFGNVWLNPPFSDWKEWAPKICNEIRRGHISQMCLLCATRTLTAKYLSPVHELSDSICIFKGRYRFWGEYARPSPDDGHAVFYFGSFQNVFDEVFSEIGNVYHSSTA